MAEEEERRTVDAVRLLRALAEQAMQENGPEDVQGAADVSVVPSAAVGWLREAGASKRDEEIDQPHEGAARWRSRGVRHHGGRYRPPTRNRGLRARRPLNIRLHSKMLGRRPRPKKGPGPRRTPALTWLAPNPGAVCSSSGARSCRPRGRLPRWSARSKCASNASKGSYSPPSRMNKSSRLRTDCMTFAHTFTVHLYAKCEHILRGGLGRRQQERAVTSEDPGRR